MKPKWVGIRAYFLLHRPPKDWAIIFPENTQGSLKTTRKDINRKIKQGLMMSTEVPQDYSPDQTPEEIKVRLDKEIPDEIANILGQYGIDAEGLTDVEQTGFHIGYIKNSDGEIEYTRPLPSIKTGKTRQKLTDFLSQADPVKVTPTRSKPPKRDFKLLFAFGDSQIDYRQIDGELIPIHDERALKVVRLMCRDLRPDTIVNLGDTLDLAALSRFQADSDHFQHSLNPAINRVHRLYAELRSDNPLPTKIVEVDSNHNTRLGKFILKNVPHLYGLRRAGVEDPYPVLTYPFLTNLEALNVDWVSGYGAAEYVYGEEYGKPPIIFKHGNTMVSNGSTASKESKENETHVVRGHGHRNEVHHKTNRRGEYLASVMVGCTCSIEGDVSSYHSAVDDLGRVVKNQENWQQSILLIEDYGGDYNFINVPITKGIARYNGRAYDGSHPKQ